MAKAVYFSSKIKDSKYDSKTFWQQLKFLGTVTKLKVRPKWYLILMEKGETCFDSIKVANNNNEFYTSIASTLVKKFLLKTNLALSQMFSKSTTKIRMFVGMLPNYHLSQLTLYSKSCLDWILTKFWIRWRTSKIFERWCHSNWRSHYFYNQLVYNQQLCSHWNEIYQSETLIKEK